MNRLPPASTDTPVGPLNFASVPGPPSPENLASHWPAIVVMIPLTETLRIVWRAGSALYRLPVPSTASPYGTPVCPSREPRRPQSPRSILGRQPLTAHRPHRSKSHTAARPQPKRRATTRGQSDLISCFLDVLGAPGLRCPL